MIDHGRFYKDRSWWPFLANPDWFGLIIINHNSSWLIPIVIDTKGQILEIYKQKITILLNFSLLMLVIFLDEALYIFIALFKYIFIKKILCENTVKVCLISYMYSIWKWSTCIRKLYTYKQASFALIWK